MLFTSFLIISLSTSVNAACTITKTDSLSVGDAKLYEIINATHLTDTVEGAYAGTRMFDIGHSINITIYCPVDVDAEVRPNGIDDYLKNNNEIWCIYKEGLGCLSQTNSDKFFASADSNPTTSYKILLGESTDDITKLTNGAYNSTLPVTVIIVEK